MTKSGPSLFRLPPSYVSLLFGFLLGPLFVGALTWRLGDSAAATILLDKGGSFPYPFTIQNLSHILFFFGLGELFVRWRTAVWEEGFGLVALESICANRPVIAFRSGGLPEIITDGENGLLVTKGDIQAA